MATAVSKPSSQGPKMKRPPPPILQTGLNGVKSSHPYTSPSSVSKRLPGINQSAYLNSTSGATASHAINRAINRTKREPQKLGEASSRSHRLPTRAISTEMDRRVTKKFPEPYGLYQITNCILGCIADILLQSKRPLIS
jgi:transcription factor SPT20